MPELHIAVFIGALVITLGGGEGGRGCLRAKNSSLSSSNQLLAESPFSSHVSAWDTTFLACFSSYIGKAM